VVLVLRPDVSALNVYAVAALVSALAISVSMLLIRALKDDTAEAIVGWQAIGLVVLFCGPALYGWVALDGAAVLGCLAVGVLLWLAQHLNVLAYRHAAAGKIQSAEASRLAIALAIDAVVFGIIPSATVVAGVALIILAVGFGTAVWRRRGESNAREPL
jgi:drug/metabolite transporter (DMT)-like permease